MQQAIGQEKFDAFNGPLWYEAGKAAKGFADSAGLPTEDAGDFETAIHLMAKVSTGPEFEFTIVEASKDRCVGTIALSITFGIIGTEPEIPVPASY